MKATYTLLLVSMFVLTHYSAYAQGLPPSTVRQVFALEKGDSLEYHEWTSMLFPGCPMFVCDIYKMKVVDSVYYNQALDTLNVLFHNTLLYKRNDTASSSSCNVCQDKFYYVPDPFSIDSGRWTLTELDSNIDYYLRTQYYSVGVANYRDTSYIESGKYNDAQQNKIDVSFMIMSYTGEIYVDSIGIVYKTEYHESASNNNEQLIYYHRANGKTWGTPYINVGIHDLADVAKINVYPNPAMGRLMVQSEVYAHRIFEMYNLLSQKVETTSLTARETTINVSELPAGIYTWKLSDGNSTIKAGKMIIE